MSDPNQEDAAPVESPDAEELDEEPRNLLLALVSEIKIGMDLSRITLPTFILEPRSMLEKLTDFMTHGEFLTQVQNKQDPLDRIVAVVKWYLSGFYIRPQGAKKPYNPILGEFFRCRWDIGDNTTIHYVAEQVSHHPPISCLYFSNRKDGFIINGYLAPRSKFMGTSVASIMDGCATLVLLSHNNEEYTVTFPSVYGRGILFGTLLMELVGVVTIECKQTNCKAEIDFKAKPFFGGEYNSLQGKIKKGKDTMYTLSGRWDNKIEITNNKKNTEILWDPKTAHRTPKVTLPIDEQDAFESQKLWTHVTAAIKKKDQREATAEKTKLEDGQRATVKNRKELGQEWEPRLFRHDGEKWIYRYYNATPYDPSEGEQAESDGIIYSTAKGKEAAIAEAQEREREAAEEAPLSSSSSLKASAGYRGSGGSSGNLSDSGGLKKGKSNGKNK